jgi:hypothetical protein
MERWIQGCRHELLDRTLIDLEPAASAARPARVRAAPQHPPTPPGNFERRPFHPLPEPIGDPDTITRLDIRRRNRLGGVLHEYERAA